MSVMRKFFSIVFLFAVLLSLPAQESAEEERCIDIIRSGAFTIYPDITVDQLFSPMTGLQWSVRPDSRKPHIRYVRADGLMTVEGVPLPTTFFFRLDTQTASWRVERVVTAGIESLSANDLGEILDYLQMAQDKNLHPAIRCVRSGFFADSQYGSTTVGRMFDTVFAGLKWSVKDSGRRNRFYVTASGKIAHNGAAFPAKVVFDVDTLRETWEVCEIELMGSRSSSAWDIAEMIDMIDSVFYGKSGEYF